MDMDMGMGMGMDMDMDMGMDMDMDMDTDTDMDMDMDMDMAGSSFPGEKDRFDRVHTSRAMTRPRPLPTTCLLYTSPSPRD